MLAGEDFSRPLDAQVRAGQAARANRTLRILLVDDEALALRRLELLLERLPEVELAGTARSGADALSAIAALKPDVVLLDIKMGEMGGFEVVQSLQGPHVPLVVFVTAFDEFATRAFEVSAVDYVVKPVEFDRLRAALDKARSALGASDADIRIAELNAVVEALRRGRAHPANRRETEIWAQRRGEFVRVPVDAIEWVEAERDYVHLHTAQNPYMIRETMASIEERLGPERFVRIRRSALVRIDQVEAVRRAGYGDFRVQLRCGVQLRVGRTYVSKVRALIASAPRASAA
jgi:DNA-binding LytR/AlgR family response regulator